MSGRRAFSVWHAKSECYRTIRRVRTMALPLSSACMVSRQASGATGDDSLADDSVAPVERLRNHFEFLAARYADFGNAKGCLIGNMAAEASANMPLVPQTMAESLAKWTQSLATAIRSGQDGGSFVRGLDANQTARRRLDAAPGLGGVTYAGTSVRCGNRRPSMRGLRR